MAWYDNKSNANAMIDKIVPTGALAAKAIGDSFTDIAKIIDDREKANIEKEKADREALKASYEIEALKNNSEQTKANNLYNRYIDPKTGVFNEELFVQENPNGNLNNVTLEAKQNAYNIQNAYETKTKNNDKEKIGLQIGSVLMSSKNEKDFYANLPDDLKTNIDQETALKIKQHYNKSEVDLAKIENANAKLQLQQELGNAKLALQQEKANNSNSVNQRDVKSADDSLIGKNIVNYFGAMDEFGNWNMEDDKKPEANKVMALASKIYKNNTNLTHNEASQLAIVEYEKAKQQEAEEKEEKKSQEVLKNGTKEDKLKELNKMLGIAK